MRFQLVKLLVSCDQMKVSEKNTHRAEKTEKYFPQSFRKLIIEVPSRRGKHVSFAENLKKLFFTLRSVCRLVPKKFSSGTLWSPPTFANMKKFCFSARLEPTCPSFPDLGTKTVYPCYLLVQVAVRSYQVC